MDFLFSVARNYAKSIFGNDMFAPESAKFFNAAKRFCDSMTAIGPKTGEKFVNADDDADYKPSTKSPSFILYECCFRFLMDELVGQDSLVELFNAGGQGCFAATLPYVKPHDGYKGTLEPIPRWQRGQEKPKFDVEVKSVHEQCLSFETIGIPSDANYRHLLTAALLKCGFETDANVGLVLSDLRNAFRTPVEIRDECNKIGLALLDDFCQKQNPQLDTANLSIFFDAPEFMWFASAGQDICETFFTAMAVQSAANVTNLTKKLENFQVAFALEQMAWVAIDPELLNGEKKNQSN